MAVLAASLPGCAAQKAPQTYSTYAIPAGDFQRMMKRAKEITSELGIKDEAVAREFAFGISVLGEEKVIALHKELGIEYFTRYSKAALEDTYRNYILGEKNKRPVLLVVFNKNDWNGAFGVVSDEIDQLMKGYRMVIAETSNEDGFYSAIRKTAQKAGKIDTLFIGGHGTMAEINLGKDMGEKGEIDIADEDELKALRGNFIDSPVIVLLSCETGKYEDFTVGAMISNALNATVIAPELPSNTRGFLLDAKGRVQDMIPTKGKTRRYVAGRKQDSVLYEAIWPRGHCINFKDYVEAKQAAHKKCKGDVYCTMGIFRSGYDDDSTPFYKESFSGLGHVGDTVARFPNDAMGMTEMRIESINDDGVVFVASGKALDYEVLPSGTTVVSGFRERVEQFSVQYGEQPVLPTEVFIDDFSSVGSGELGVWSTIRQYLHLRSFTVEKTSQEGTVKISVHRERFCDVKYDLNY